jgi:hypothetical protein
MTRGEAPEEIQGIRSILTTHSKRVLIYLRLLNCGAATIREGMNRIVTKYTPPASFLRASAAPRLRVKPKRR